jgi:hypothetical protein
MKLDGGRKRETQASRAGNHAADLASLDVMLSKIAVRLLLMPPWIPTP